jgi:hypothetical protein
MVKAGTKDELNVGDMIRVEKAVDCLGFIVELSDAWTPNEQHHAKVFWIAGDYANVGASCTWVPINILECISKTTI